MIKLENYEVVGWEHAIRGMRNPKNSWERSDSGPAFDCKKCGRIEREGICETQGRYCSEFECFYIGPNDHTLMMNLAKGGPVHAKYRRFIDVYVDITAPLYWWKEFDTYKVGTAANSCSTMHKIHDKEFTLEDFSCERLIADDACIVYDIPLIDGRVDDTQLGFIDVLEITIDALNSARQLYLDTKDKIYWWQMIQLLPSSYNQKRTVKLNYEVLANIYTWRKDHKLDCWRDFCAWIETLPYSEVITGNVEKDA